MGIFPEAMPCSAVYCYHLFRMILPCGRTYHKQPLRHRLHAQYRSQDQDIPLHTLHALAHSYLTERNPRKLEYPIFKTDFTVCFNVYYMHSAFSKKPQRLYNSTRRYLLRSLVNYLNGVAATYEVYKPLTNWIFCRYHVIGAGSPSRRCAHGYLLQHLKPLDGMSVKLCKSR